jgi:hypothetical protein
MSKPEFDIQFDIADLGDLGTEQVQDQTFDPIADPVEPVIPDAEPEAVVEAAPAPVKKDEPAPLKVVENDPAPAADADEPSIISEVLSKLGYDDIDEDFDESTEGIVKLTQKVGERIAGETLDELFERNPSLKQHFEFIRSGGDPRVFLEAQREPNFAQMQIGDTDTDLAKDLLRTYFKAKGEEEGFINDILETYEDKKQLIPKANQAKEALATAQARRTEQLVAQQKEQAVIQQKEAEKVWNTVKEKISTVSDFAGLPVTEKDRSKFLEYISAPVDREGRTKRDLDLQKLDLDKQLALDFLLYKGLDIKGIVDTKARTQQAQTLRDRLRKDARPTGKTTARTAPASQDLSDITLDDLI